MDSQKPQSGYRPAMRVAAFDWVDFIGSRAERYGLAVLLLLVLIGWLKPLMEAVVQDHREFLRKTNKTQEQQAEILSDQKQHLQALEHNQDVTGRQISNTADMVRDIHIQVVDPKVQRSRFGAVLQKDE